MSYLKSASYKLRATIIDLEKLEEKDPVIVDMIERLEQEEEQLDSIIMNSEDEDA